MKYVSLCFISIDISSKILLPQLPLSATSSLAIDPSSMNSTWVNGKCPTLKNKTH